MTKMEFKFDDLVLDDITSISDDLLLEVITETCFLIPVRLIVNGNNVFAFTTPVNQKMDWINLPAFGLLIDWPSKIESLPKTHKEKIFLADMGEMTFSYENDIVKVRTNINRLEPEEDYVALHTVIESSIKDLKEKLLHKIPEVLKNSVIRQELKL
jgi:hypothetical protein